MSHLTDEQFEDLMQGNSVRFAHLKDCIECRGRLVEKKALANRLRLVYHNMKAPVRLAERICQQLNIRSMLGKQRGGNHFLKTWTLRKTWIKVTSVAAVLMITVSLFLLFFVGPATALAAKAELVDIHENNLSAKHGFYSQTNPEKMSDYFKSELGVSPIILQIRQGQSLQGCCLCRFIGQKAGSYVVETPQGLMSIVVVMKHPKSIGMKRSFRQGKYTFWAGSYTSYKLVAVRIGQYSYCAVGEVADTHLTHLLAQLTPNQ